MSSRSFEFSSLILATSSFSLLFSRSLIATSELSPRLLTVTTLLEALSCVLTFCAYSTAWSLSLDRVLILSRSLLILSSSALYFL